VGTCLLDNEVFNGGLDQYFGYDGFIRTHSDGLIWLHLDVG
jgi:hypothetical protein